MFNGSCKEMNALLQLICLTLFVTNSVLVLSVVGYVSGKDYLGQLPFIVGDYVSIFTTKASSPLVTSTITWTSTNRWGDFSNVATWTCDGRGDWTATNLEGPFLYIQEYANSFNGLSQYGIVLNYSSVNSQRELLLARTQIHNQPLDTIYFQIQNLFFQSLKLYCLPLSQYPVGRPYTDKNATILWSYPVNCATGYNPALEVKLSLKAHPNPTGTVITWYVIMETPEGEAAQLLAIMPHLSWISEYYAENLFFQAIDAVCGTSSFCFSLDPYLCL